MAFTDKIDEMNRRPTVWLEFHNFKKALVTGQYESYGLFDNTKSVTDVPPYNILPKRL